MTDLSEINKMREENGFTCVLSDGNKIYTSEKKGIMPLIEWIESGWDFRGFMAADLIVGKAAMLLYAYMGISMVYAHVLSQKALPIAKKYNIIVQYDVLTPQIINRKGTGSCPMEEVVEYIDNCTIAKENLLEKVCNL